VKTIEYSQSWPLCAIFADSECEHDARLFLTDPVRDHITVANELFITAARVLIAEGVIPHTEVQFQFRGQIMTVYPDGSLDHWPAGFCDTSELLLCRILGARMNRVKI
jgi:hypothetical protein